MNHSSLRKTNLAWSASYGLGGCSSELICLFHAHKNCKRLEPPLPQSFTVSMFVDLVTSPPRPCTHLCL